MELVCASSAALTLAGRVTFEGIAPLSLALMWINDEARLGSSKQVAEEIRTKVPPKADFSS
jgi:hypothetical protein